MKKGLIIGLTMLVVIAILAMFWIRDFEKQGIESEIVPTLTIEEEYRWVNSFEDCVKAEGQLSSDQYIQRTGNPRTCVTPDGREFTEGKEGWKRFEGG